MYRPDPQDGFPVLDYDLYLMQEELLGQDGDYMGYDEWLDENGY